MSIIGEVNLRECHEAWLKFSGFSGTLPGGRIDLKVTDGIESWVFECDRQSDGEYRIRGKDWGSFVRQNTNAMLTLYSKEDD
ncbi:hypothetical protein V6N13_085241 [Hibiscus sabdariffa]|uniref:TF-B3 domain-containing protein n=1 Tax=Hibiscus sabdariffa TaxID=183260 RepID=A0ABR2D3S9_9ROSI